MITLKNVGAVVALAAACACTPAPPTSQSESPPTFASPEQAVEAAVQAAVDGVPALIALLGPDGKDLVDSGDSVQDANDRAAFVRLAREKTTIVKDPSSPDRVTVVVGNDGFPMAVPIVERDGRWMFDTDEGRYESLLRRIGSNELDAIEVCRGYVEAQQEYAELDPEKTGIHQYAQRIISTPGRRDGLYWKGGDGGPESPISEGIARVIAEGYKSIEPYHGYYYKVLTAQGASAPLGEMDFMVRGYLIGGFALVAWPAQYQVSGVKTFIVSHDGIVYERDLGPDTAKIASEMTRFDPDENWTVVS